MKTRPRPTDPRLLLPYWMEAGLEYRNATVGCISSMSGIYLRRWATRFRAKCLGIRARLAGQTISTPAPASSSASALLLLALAFVALEFGTGPSLLATGLGAFLFDMKGLQPAASYGASAPVVRRFRA